MDVCGVHDGTLPVREQGFLVGVVKSRAGDVHDQPAPGLAHGCNYAVWRGVEGEVRVSEQAVGIGQGKDQCQACVKVLLMKILDG